MPLLETEHFDLLLTDIVMPEMDGIELAQKASAIDPSIRVMFITGFAAVALQGGRTAPEAKLLSKPFHLKDLVMEVDRIFQTEDQHGQLLTLFARCGPRLSPRRTRSRTSPEASNR